MGEEEGGEQLDTDGNDGVNTEYKEQVGEGRTLSFERLGPGTSTKANPRAKTLPKFGFNHQYHTQTFRPLPEHPGQRPLILVQVTGTDHCNH